MGIVIAFITCLKKSFKLQGRARRKEYWSFALGFWVLEVLCLVISTVCAFDFGMALAGLIFLLCLPATITVTVRRLHDHNLAGWWFAALGVVDIMYNVLKPFLDFDAFGILVTVIAVVVTLVWLYLMARRGTVGANKYGPDPLGDIPTV